MLTDKNFQGAKLLLLPAVLPADFTRLVDATWLSERSYHIKKKQPYKKKA